MRQRIYEIFNFSIVIVNKLSYQTETDVFTDGQVICKGCFAPQDKLYIAQAN